MRQPSYVPGTTVRSVAACVFAMLVAAVMLVFGEAIEGSGWFYGMPILAIPAMVSVLAVLVLAGGMYALTRARLLTRAELVCVYFCVLTAVPIMGMGFWTNFIWLSSTIPTQGDFEKIDAVDDLLWPHGPNLLHEAFQPDRPGLIPAGNVQWRETEYDEHRRGILPVLINTAQDAVSSLRVRIPLERDGQPVLDVGERYLLSVLAHTTGAGPGAVFSCRIYYDDHPVFDVEAFAEPQPRAQPTFLHKSGFRRYGVYGTEIGRAVQRYIDVEFRLAGEGTVALADPKLMSVAAFETLFTGRESVSEAEYRALRPSERSAYAARPDSLWSRAAIKSVIGGYVPWRDWRAPLLMWMAFIGLLLLSSFAVAVVMRRQWVKNERYPLPLTRIPLALFGIEEEAALPAIWKSRVMWLGFAVCLVWCLLRMWHAFNSNVPNLGIDVQLKPYFDDPAWGQMWTGVTFSISAIVLSLAVFMELNVLLSLVIGFFLFRSLHWLGEANGWNIASTGKYGIGAYPYANEQLVAAYVTYGLLTLFFTRKYLWQVAREAIRGRADAHSTPDSEEDEPFSSRVAACILAASTAGAIAWGKWVAIPPHAMVVLFGCMVLFAFVAMKIRAECGTPFAWFTPGTVLLAPLLGGMAFFGARGAMLASWTTVGMVLLFVVPGLQLEFIEVARRVRMIPRHVLYTLVLGVVAGMTIGGWFFLSGMYGTGSNNSGFSYLFNARPWEFYPYIEMQRAADATVADAVGGAAPAAPSATKAGIDPSTWGYVGGAVVTAGVTLLRQAFPAFWFHPVGIVLAATADGLGMLAYWSINLWGSLLAAWAIRLAVLKLGGAATVRNGLFPFFIGVFLAAVLAQFILFGVHGYLYFFDMSSTRQGVMF